MPFKIAGGSQEMERLLGDPGMVDTTNERGSEGTVKKVKRS